MYFVLLQQSKNKHKHKYVHVIDCNWHWIYVTTYILMIFYNSFFFLTRERLIKNQIQTMKYDFMLLVKSFTMLVEFFYVES